MSKPEDIPQDVMEAAQRVAYQVFESMTGAEAHNAIALAIMAAKAEGAKQQRDYDVGHIMTVVESLMEGRMTDAGLTKQDHLEMQAQIEALEVVADEIQALTRYVNTAHNKKSQEV